MTDDEIIANQARKIEEMSETIKKYEESRKKIRMILYSVGAPLNDNFNFLQYSKDQLIPFFEIADEVE